MTSPTEIPRLEGELDALAQHTAELSQQVEITRDPDQRREREAQALRSQSVLASVGATLAARQ